LFLEDQPTGDDTCECDRAPASRFKQQQQRRLTEGNK